MLITSYLNYSRPVPSDPGWVNKKSYFLKLKVFLQKRLPRKNILMSYDNQRKQNLV